MIVVNKTETLARQIMEIIPLVMRTVAAELRRMHPMMTPSHLRMLHILQQKPTSITELAEHQAVSLPTMSNTVTFMETQGWVRRLRTAVDRRRVVIEITPVGQDMLEQVRQRTETRVVEVIRALPLDDQERISQGLLILQDVFEAVSATSVSCER